MNILKKVGKWFSGEDGAEKKVEPRHRKTNRQARPENKAVSQKKVAVPLEPLLQHTPHRTPQGLLWFANALLVDCEGDLAHEFFEVAAPGLNSQKGSSLSRSQGLKKQTKRLRTVNEVRQLLSTPAAFLPISQRKGRSNRKHNKTDNKRTRQSTANVKQVDFAAAVSPEQLATYNLVRSALECSAVFRPVLPPHLQALISPS